MSARDFRTQVDFDNPKFNPGGVLRDLIAVAAFGGAAAGFGSLLGAGASGPEAVGAGALGALGGTAVALPMSAWKRAQSIVAEHSQARDLLNDEIRYVENEIGFAGWSDSAGSWLVDDPKAGETWVMNEERFAEYRQRKADKGEALAIAEFKDDNTFEVRMEVAGKVSDYGDAPAVSRVDLGTGERTYAHVPEADAPAPDAEAQPKMAT